MYHSDSRTQWVLQRGLWAIMFIIETQAILEVYPTYLRGLMNNLLRCHYCEFTETAFQWKDNLHAFISWKQVRENNDLNNHAEKILFFFNLNMCYLFQFQTLRIFNNILLRQCEYFHALSWDDWAGLRTPLFWYLQMARFAYEWQKITVSN